MSFRCTHCDLNWPANNTYVKCPRCDRRTSYMVMTTAMNASEVKHAMFNIFYENREARLAEEWAAKVTPDEVCQGIGE